MGRIIALIFAALFVVGTWGARFLASSEPGREGVISFISAIDAWLLRDAYSPVLMIIGGGGLFGLWVAMPLARFWREKWFGATRREFSRQFRSVEQTMARRNFRWNLEQAYRKHNPKAKRGELADMLRALKWPSDFPPDDDVIAYSKKIEWPDDNGKKLWAFMDGLFSDDFDISERSKKLDNEHYHDLLMGRLIAAKFWDDWARQMTKGLLNPNSIADLLESNRPDIKALALAKLALGKTVGWDRSKGTTALFRLAQKHLEIAGGTWAARARRYVGGLVETIGKRISGNGWR